MVEATMPDMEILWYASASCVSEGPHMYLITGLLGGNTADVCSSPADMCLELAHTCQGVVVLLLLVCASCAGRFVITDVHTSPRPAHYQVSDQVVKPYGACNYSPKHSVSAGVVAVQTLHAS